MRNRNTNSLPEKLIVEITSSGAKLETRFVGGSSSIKSVSNLDLANIFAGSIVLDTGILPTQHGICYYGEVANGNVFAYTEPPMIRSVRFGRRGQYENHRAYVPRTYWFLKTDKPSVYGERKIHRIAVWAANHVIKKESDRLSRLPFCNVYEQGNICWGTSGTPTSLRSLASIQDLVEKFWSAPFNGDIEGRKISFGYKKDDPTQVVRLSNTTAPEDIQVVNSTQEYFKYTDLLSEEQKNVVEEIFMSMATERSFQDCIGIIR